METENIQDSKKELQKTQKISFFERINKLRTEANEFANRELPKKQFLEVGDLLPIVLKLSNKYKISYSIDKTYVVDETALRFEGGFTDLESGLVKESFVEVPLDLVPAYDDVLRLYDIIGVYMIQRDFNLGIKKISYLSDELNRALGLD